MPPSGSSPQSDYGKDISQHEDVYYSNDDIDRIFQIIFEAKEKISHPSDQFNFADASSSAQNSAVLRNCYEIDSDQRYAWMFTRIQQTQGTGSILEKLDKVLRDMGIEIEIGVPEDVLSTSENQIKEANDIFTNKNDFLSAPNQNRQNSETSLLEIEARNKLPTKRGSYSPLYIETKTRLKDSKDSKEVNKERTKFQQSNRNRFSSNNYDTSNNKHIGAWLASKHSNSYQRSHSSLSSSENCKEALSAPKNQPIQPFPTSVDYQAASATTAPTSAFDEETTSHSTRSIQKPHQIDYWHSIDLKASLFLNRHIALLTVPWLQTWKNHALQIREHNHFLEVIAHNQYKKTLTSAAVHNWRIESRERKSVKDTENYFELLYDRASKARNLYLLYIAFSHWLNYTKERVKYTSRVRKRIIRARIFNAWCDLTAVDELKVKRQILKKNFSMWRRRCLYLVYDNYTAITKYEGDLVKKYYLKWLRESFVSRASSRWTERKMYSIFLEWNFKFRKMCQQKSEAEITHRSQVCVRTIRMWKFHTRKRLDHYDRAKSCFRHKIARELLSKWFKEVKITPAKNKVQTLVKYEKIRVFFQIWLHRTREERRATFTDRAKILREALIHWRHKTRFHLFRMQFNNHLIQLMMYKWIVQTRSILGARIRNQNRLRDTLYIWRLKWQALGKSHSEQDELAQEILARKTLNCVFLRWYSSMGYLQKTRLLAGNFHRPRVLHRVIQKWINKTHHLQQLENWSGDARFYLSSFRVLKRWKESTESTKREKRKIAYTQVRRMAKMNLARSVLRVWLVQAQRALDMHFQAAEMNHKNTIIIGMEIFDRWHSYIEELLQVNTLWRNKEFQIYLTTWQDRIKRVLALETEAVVLFFERRAGRALKKWGLKYLQARARTNHALDIRQKNDKKISRKILTCWRQKTGELILTKPLVCFDQDLLGDIARNEAWSELGEENEIDNIRKRYDTDSTPAPTPKYLLTPKKSERLKIAGIKYSMTPKTPLSTLYERELWSKSVASSILEKKMTKSKYGLSNLKHTLQEFEGDNANSKSP